MKKQTKTTLGRVVSMIPGNQDVIVRGYLTGTYQEHASASVICDRLDCMQETREAQVYRIEYQDGAITIDIL